MPDREPIGLLVAVARKRLKQAVQVLSGEMNLSAQQFWIIVGIADQGQISLGDLAARRHMDQPTACRVVAALTRRRLLRSRRDLSDRRRTVLELTASGKELAARCLPAAMRVRKAIDQALGPAERDAVASGLTKIVASLERLMNEVPRTRRRASPDDD